MKEEISFKMIDPFLDLTKISDSSLHEVFTSLVVYNAYLHYVGF